MWKVEILVSFDVSSLFTNVCISEVVSLICERLRKDDGVLFVVISYREQ